MRAGSGRSNSSGRRRGTGALIATVLALSGSAFLDAGAASAASPSATAQALVGT